MNITGSKCCTDIQIALPKFAHSKPKPDPQTRTVNQKRRGNMPLAEKDAAALYAQAMLEVLERVRTTQGEAIQAAAHIIADALIKGGILRTFGAGHSGLVAGDIVYRAGGLAPVDMLAEHGLAGHTEVLKSEFLERLEGYAAILLDYHEIRPPDVMLVISNSGRNAAA